MVEGAVRHSTGAAMSAPPASRTSATSLTVRPGSSVDLFGEIVSDVATDSGDVGVVLDEDEPQPAAASASAANTPANRGLPITKEYRPRPRGTEEPCRPVRYAIRHRCMTA